MNDPLVEHARDVEKKIDNAISDLGNFTWKELRIIQPDAVNDFIGDTNDDKEDLNIRIDNYINSKNDLDERTRERKPITKATKEFERAKDKIDPKSSLKIRELEKKYSPGVIRQHDVYADQWWKRSGERGVAIDAETIDFKPVYIETSPDRYSFHYLKEKDMSLAKRHFRELVVDAIARNGSISKSDLLDKLLKGEIPGDDEYVDRLDDLTGERKTESPGIQWMRNLVMNSIPVELGRAYCDWDRDFDNLKRTRSYIISWKSVKNYDRVGIADRVIQLERPKMNASTKMRMLKAEYCAISSPKIDRDTKNNLVKKSTFSDILDVIKDDYPTIERERKLAFQMIDHYAKNGMPSKDLIKVFERMSYGY